MKVFSVKTVFFYNLCYLFISLVCLIRSLVDFIRVNTQLWEMSGQKTTQG